ncbi:MAG: iron hydrogenase small subunit, partial [Firmicutes bacterium]|nr:iron hydrogenase small subunit [Bacillota bacterium]
FIEIMACPGGCIGGGGQPIQGKAGKKDRANREVKQLRTSALYRIDAGKKFRRSHENPAIRQIYDEFLGSPLSDRAREILHTTYTARGRVLNKMLH